MGNEERVLQEVTSGGRPECQAGGSREKLKCDIGRQLPRMGAVEAGPLRSHREGDRWPPSGYQQARTTGCKQLPSHQPLRSSPAGQEHRGFDEKLLISWELPVQDQDQNQKQ